MTGDFNETVAGLLEDNGAVNRFSIHEERGHASAVAHSRAGIDEKNRIVSDPLSEGYDVTYEGTWYGWEHYIIQDVDPGDVPGDLDKLVPEYRSEAPDSYTVPSFSEWLEDRE